jgi:CheY-like chemotaxis protein
MPGMSGIQLARHIRSMRATQRIILLTGFGFDGDHLPPEIDTVVRKPIAADRLRAAMLEVVNRS